MLLDTSGLLAFHHKAEPQHVEAVRLFTEASVRVSHNYVLAEFVALAEARHLPREPALSFAQELLDNPLVTVDFVDEATHREAMALLQQRLDKSWSLCDAVSFMLMQRRGIREAFTTDHHFDQMGMIRLLNP